jgi:septal ring-binding cell division protein DamX
VGAFSFAAGSADSAQIVNLPAGGYTIQISGVGNTTGVALAEVYEVP